MSQEFQYFIVDYSVVCRLVWNCSNPCVLGTHQPINGSQKYRIFRDNWKIHNIFVHVLISQMYILHLRHILHKKKFTVCDHTKHQSKSLWDNLILSICSPSLWYRIICLHPKNRSRCKIRCGSLYQPKLDIQYN